MPPKKKTADESDIVTVTTDTEAIGLITKDEPYFAPLGDSDGGSADSPKVEKPVDVVEETGEPVVREHPVYAEGNRFIAGYDHNGASVVLEVVSVDFDEDGRASYLVQRAL